MADETPEPVTEDPMIAALLRERAGYVQRGLVERVAEVDEQIRHHGGTPPDDGPPPIIEVTEETPPRGRRTPGRSRG